MTLKTLTAAAFLALAPVVAAAACGGMTATPHSCPPGTHWDAGAGPCVAPTTS